MKAFIVNFSVALALVLGAAACASAPSAFVPDDSMVQALADAKSEAEKQQKLAQDFGGNEYFSGEYQQAQALAAEAGSLNPASAEEYTTATEKYRSVAEAYRRVSEKSLPRYFDEKSRTAEEARGKAAAAGAGQEGVWEDGAGQLALADGDAAEGARLFGAKDYYGARDAYNSALSRYGVVETEALCYALKAEIEQYGLQGYDPNTFALGEDSLKKALTAYNAKDLTAAKSAAENALSNYQTVAALGWEGLAFNEAEKAKSEQTKALDIKADVAMKDDYEAAAAIYSQGENARDGREFRQAHGIFVQAGTMFAEVYQLTARQRQSADTLIKAADKKIAESAQKAKDAQQQITGGRR